MADYDWVGTGGGWWCHSEVEPAGVAWMEWSLRSAIQVPPAMIMEAERFVALVNRERFDYTEWRKTQWQDETVASLATKARRLRAARPNEPLGE